MPDICDAGTARADEMGIAYELLLPDWPIRIRANQPHCRDGKHLSSTRVARWAYCITKEEMI